MQQIALPMSRHRSLRLRGRRDLTLIQSDCGEEWIAKDPVGLKYFRIDELAYLVLKSLDGKKSAHQIVEEVSGKCPSRRFKSSQLFDVIRMLHSYGLLISDGSGQADALLTRRSSGEARQLSQRLVNVLAIRLPGIDPERHLNRLYRRLSWVYHPFTVTLCILLILGSVFFVVSHFQEFLVRIPHARQYFTGGNLVFLIATVSLAKILHEIGHGLTCRHFGAECHEMGLMFLVFTPCLYCDTSDMWQIQNRFSRAKVAFAGVYVELILASLAVIVWWNTQPGLLNFMCISLMLVCSVSTLLVNGNPLLRFDGYFVLADLVGIPNLNERARRLFSSQIIRLVFGKKFPTDSTIGMRKQLFMIGWVVASTIYRLLIQILIMWFLHRASKAIGLSILGELLIAFVLATKSLSGAQSVIRFFRRSQTSNHINFFRFGIVTFLAVSALTTIAFLPVTRMVNCTVVLQPADAVYVSAQTSGLLKKLHHFPGDLIEKGDAVATLENPNLTLEVARLKSRCNLLKKRIEGLERRVASSDAADLLPVAHESFKNAEKQLLQRTSELERSKVLSPATGMVYLPPSILEYDPGITPLARPIGNWFLSENADAWMERGTLLCVVGNPNKVVAIVRVEEGQVSLVDVGDKVSVQIDAYPGRVFTGKVSRISEFYIAANMRGSLQSMPLAAEASGSFEAEVEVDYEGQILLPGATGSARISTGIRTVGQIAWRKVLETIRFR